LPPLENGRAWHVRNDLDVAAMMAVASGFLGRHDFASFAANRGAPVADTVRTIGNIRLRQSGPRISIEVEGDGFHYKMVRLMVGTLVRIGLGMAAPNEIRSRLDAPRRGNRHGRNAAPAAGLFLVRVRY
jgi:tRNA pseudouridine38-40 synthase